MVLDGRSGSSKMAVTEPKAMDAKKKKKTQTKNCQTTLLLLFAFVVESESALAVVFGSGRRVLVQRGLVHVDPRQRSLQLAIHHRLSAPQRRQLQPVNLF